MPRQLFKLKQGIFLVENNTSGVLERFRTLLEIYLMTGGHQKYLIIPQVLAKNLGFDVMDQEKYPLLIDNIVYLTNEGLLKSDRGTFITNLAINEVEDSIIEPGKGTFHFPPNIIRFFDVNESIIKLINDMRKGRKDFLITTYDIAGGLETKLVAVDEVNKLLGLDTDTFNKVYWYLIEDGLIEIEYSGVIKLTHFGRLKIEDQTPSADDAFWHALYPDITISDDIVTIIDDINSSSRSIFGFEIFKNRAGPIKDLRISIGNLNKDSKDKSAFISCLLSIALILGDVYVNDIKKRVIAEKDDGPLILVEKLFNVQGIEDSKTDFILLRKLVRLRSTTPPIHNAEEESIKVLEYLGINFPIVDWAETAEICLNHLETALKGILEKLQNNDSKN